MYGFLCFQLKSLLLEAVPRVNYVGKCIILYSLLDVKVNLYCIFLGKTLLGRRRLKVIFSDQEKLLLLRAYQAHPCDWNNVISTMRDNLDNLPNEKVRNFYKEASIKSLKDRLCGKLSGMLKNSEKESDEVRYVF